MKNTLFSLCTLALLSCGGSAIEGTNIKVTLSVDADILTAIGGKVLSLSALATDGEAFVGRAVIEQNSGDFLLDADLPNQGARIEKSFVLSFNQDLGDLVEIRLAGYVGEGAEGLPVLAGRGELIVQPLNDGSQNQLFVVLDVACGNGAIDDGEGCDDGNTTDGDGCAADCSQ